MNRSGFTFFALALFLFLNYIEKRFGTTRIFLTKNKGSAERQIFLFYNLATFQRGWKGGEIKR